MEINLNENDEKLLIFCKNNTKTIREIAEYLKIAGKNVSVRINKLEKNNLIIVERKGIGKPTFITTKNGINTKKYFDLMILKHKEIIKQIEQLK